ncbi:glycoside hydrolase family 30 protein [Oidiodendron maius Zn]|uniref:Glycoside hydrolase family 30 protein n=1 Tax=Oidiodendron maius (strain Zn) TaxID=913774 RepID=A0A0C3HEI2_OIDMZ|nr:glycoside hydrolase family 30 protein [Oidiodendron maius Zn]
MHYTLQTLAVLLGYSLLTKADTTTTINPDTDWGTWEGWGTSLAWWAAAVGPVEVIAELAFTTNWVSYDGGNMNVPGLGLNIVRYNAGACSWNTYDGVSMVVSPGIISSWQMDGFWTDWASSNSTSSSWDWTVDANQREMMRLATSYGVDTFELFSNSPMWWMCINHNPSGSNDGTDDNLQSWNYESHAIYLATIAEHAANYWGITFNSVEAFNEPSSNWWNGLTGDQEGCHFAATTQALVLGHLRTALNSRGLSSTLVSASDENTYDLAGSTWSSLVNSGASSNVGRINVHGYQYGSGNRAGLYSLAQAAGVALWNSEYGEADGTGAELASNLILDFRWLHNTAWVYWQVLDSSSWGLVVADNNALSSGSISQKYYVLAQFTRHIRPGMTILDGGSDNTVAAYDATNQKLIIVAVNWGDAQYLNFDLSSFSTPGRNGALVPRWSTQIGSGDQYVSYHDTYISGTKFWSYFVTNQVQTFEVSNVAL